MRNLALITVFCALAAGEEEAGKPPMALAPYVAFRGAGSAVTKPRYVRIDGAEAWKKLWLEHAGVAAEKHNDYYNGGGVPDVDFERCMVIAIFPGEVTNSAGVDLVSVEDRHSSLRVRFRQRWFQTAGTDGGAERARPFGIFVVPRRVIYMVVEDDVQNLIGGDAVWKERAKLDGPKPW
jgi:hypothetical protein